MKLRNGAAWTPSRTVQADLRGFDGVAVRYAVGKGQFTQWRPYSRRLDVKLGRKQGNYDVRIQLRSPTQVKSPILRDSIKLDKVKPSTTRPRLSIRQGGRVAASGKRVPIKATIRAKDARSGLRNASVRAVCGTKRIARKAGKGPRVMVGAPVTRSGCAVTGTARDVAGNTARKTIRPKLQIIDLHRKSKSVKLKGAWKAARNKDAVGKSLARSASRGAKAKVTFRGQQFGVVVRRGPSGGKVKVIVDGKRVDTIDLYSAKPDDRRIVYVRNVPKGKHVVKLRPTGTRNAKSTGTAVWLDALVVLNKRK
jgi:hypothetical protein